MKIPSGFYSWISRTFIHQISRFFLSHNKNSLGIHGSIINFNERFSEKVDEGSTKFLSISLDLQWPGQHSILNQQRRWKIWRPRYRCGSSLSGLSLQLTPPKKETFTEFYRSMFNQQITKGADKFWRAINERTGNYLLKCRPILDHSRAREFYWFLQTAGKSQSVCTINLTEFNRSLTRRRREFKVYVLINIDTIIQTSCQRSNKETGSFLSFEFHQLTENLNSQGKRSWESFCP